MIYTVAFALIAAIVMLAAACSDNSGCCDSVLPEASALEVPALVETLAADAMEGRKNLSPGSQLAQKFLFEELAKIAGPAIAGMEGIEAYSQHFDLGTNMIAIVPGGDLADEYVMIGAHYDHLGSSCDDGSAEDNICNGATDNATGVAATIEIVRSIVAEGTPRRSIIITLWDSEENDLDGARYYSENPLVPLEQTIAYVNFDIQGSNLLPSIREFTILVGAETGGKNLVDAARAATGESGLDTLLLSLIFGQGRSDHAVFAGIGVPSVFFTDANNGCYHTVKDDIDAVDFPKLEQQIQTANALTRDLITTDKVPVFDATAPLSTYEDAVEMLRLVEVAQVDFGMFTPDQQVASEQFLVDLQAIVDAGPEAFNSADVGTLLGGAAALVNTFRSLDCDPYLAEV